MSRHLCAMLIVVGACDPRAGLASRQSLRPAPARACVDSVLAAANNGAVPPTLIDERTPERARRRVQYFTLRDSAFREFATHFLLDVYPDSSARLEVGILVGVALREAPDTTRVHMAAASAALLRQVRHRCAPNASADSLVCVQSGMFDRTRRCLTGAT